MTLDESCWVLSAGLTPDWKTVNRERLSGVLGRLPRIAAEFSRRAPAPLKKTRLLDGLRWFVSQKSAARDRLACHPALDYWLFLWDKHFSMPGDDENWRLQFGLFASFPLSLAVSTGKKAEFDCVLEPDAHLHLYGLPAHLELPAEHALKLARVKAGPDSLELKIDRGPSYKVPRAALLAGAPGREEFNGVKIRRWQQVASMTCESCGFLLTQGVIMHGLASPTPEEEERFAAALRLALTHVEERDPGLFAEMTDLVVSLIPLVNPKNYGSVSSSYVNMRGMIALSHADDPLLQAETLIHEFCHQKMNQLLLVDAVLEPGQAGQVYHSPWRPDARRIRGLILGAHAFLNVAAYLIKSLSREEYELQERIAVMGNVLRRLFEVEDALKTCCAYGTYTDFGARYILLMWRELQEHFHAVQWYPPGLIEEQRAAVSAHRNDFALPLTGIYRQKGFEAKVEPAPFGQPAAGGAK